MKKKIVILILLAFAFTSLFGIAGFDTKSLEAATYFQKVNFTTAVVTADTLNVRQGPSTKYPVVCVLKKGQTVKVFGKLGDWYAVYEPSKDCVGVASSQYLKAAGTTTTPAPGGKTTTPPTTNKPAPKPAASPKPTTPPKAPTPLTGITQDEQAMLDLVNAARKDAGVGPLQFDMELVKCARAKAQDMVTNNYFSHQSPTYGSPFDMMRQFGISFKTAGENIAGNQTVEAAFKAWMNSEGHRKNILSGNFNYNGLGIVDSPTYGKVFVQMFIGR